MVGIAIVLTSSAACSSSDSSVSASCIWAVEFTDVVYTDVANVDIEIGEKLGDAKLLTCEELRARDNGESPGLRGDSSEQTRTVYEIKGLASSDAIAVAEVGDSPTDAQFAVVQGDAFPAEVQAYIDDHNKG